VTRRWACERTRVQKHLLPETLFWSFIWRFSTCDTLLASSVSRFCYSGTTCTQRQKTHGRSRRQPQRLSRRIFLPTKIFPADIALTARRMSNDRTGITTEATTHSREQKKALVARACAIAKRALSSRISVFCPDGLQFWSIYILSNLWTDDSFPPIELSARCSLYVPKSDKEFARTSWT